MLSFAGCGGGSGGVRPPTSVERAQIVHAMRWWRNGDGFAAVRTFTLHIDKISVSRRDAHFAAVTIHSVDPRTRYRPWSGTCTRPSPKPLVDLYCS